MILVIVEKIEKEKIRVCSVLLGVVQSEEASYQSAPLGLLAIQSIPATSYNIVGRRSC